MYMNKKCCQNSALKFDLLVRIFYIITQVDSARKHGILLEAVQVLTDLNLSIKKAYISSDGRWFMDGKMRMLAKFSVC